MTVKFRDMDRYPRYHRFQESALLTLTFFMELTCNSRGDREGAPSL